MGANNSTTYTIDFKAQFDDLKRLQQTIQGISESADFKLDDKLKGQISSLKMDFGSAMQSLEQDMQKGLLTPEKAKTYTSLFQGLITQAQTLQQDLSKTSFGEQLQKDIKKVDNQISNLKAKIAKKTGTEGYRPELDDQGNAIAMQATPQQQAKTWQSLTRGQTGFDTAAKAQEALNQGLVEEERQRQLLLELLEQYDIQVKNDQALAVQTYNANKDGAKAEIDALQEKIQLRDQLKSGIEGTPQYQQLQELSKAATDAKVSLSAAADSTGDFNKQQKKTTTTVEDNTEELKKNADTTKKTIGQVFSFRMALQALRQLLQSSIQTIKEMDAALTNMTVVTDLTRKQAQELTTTFSALAKETGTTTTEIANMTTLYLQQGKTLADAITLTETAAKAAKIAGISGQESIDLLTNAMNGFQLKAEEALAVSDKFAALAAASATDYEEMATALSKVASQANLAGMSMDFTLGLLAKGIETTREAPETIGTALKTIIARMREITDYGETLEDGSDINRVEKALDVVGVKLRDEAGQFRDLESVLTEVGGKWDTLTTNQQANVAVALAGTRQQSRLIAMMQNFDRTQELVNISMNSAGATIAQHSKYMQGMEAATSKMTAAYQQLITNLLNSDLIIGVINTASSALETLSENTWIIYTAMGAILALSGPLLANKAAELVLTTKEIALSAISIFSKKAETKAINEQTKAKLAETVAEKSVNAEKEKEIALTTILNALKNADPIYFIVAAVVALVAAYIMLNKESETVVNFMQSMKNLFSTLGQILGSLLNIVMSLVEVIFQILEPVLDLVFTVLAAALDYVESLLKPVMLLINVIAKLVEGFVNFSSQLIDGFKNFLNDLGLTEDVLERIFLFIMSFATGNIFGILSAIFGPEEFEKQMDEALEAIEEFFMTSEQKVEKYADNIVKAQEKIYAANETKKTLDPLLDEYDELSKKANKTTEDFERLKEIEQSIGEIEGGKFKREDGTVDFEAAAQALEDADTIIKDNTAVAYREAQAAQKLLKKGTKASAETIKTIKSGISQKWLQDTLGSELEENIKANVISGFEAAMKQLSEEQLATFTEDDQKKLYDGIVEMQEILADQDAELIDKLEVYEKHLAEMPDEARDAFKAIYQSYANYSDLIGTIGSQAGKKEAFDSIAKLGLSSTSYEEMQSKWLEGDENRTKEQFDEILGSILAKGGSREEMVAALLQVAGAGEDNQEIRNAFEKNLTKGQQNAIEELTKAVSKSDNIMELQEKMLTGGLSAEELRQIGQDYEDILGVDNNWEKFQKGELTRQDLINQARAKTIEELKIELQFAKANGEADSFRVQILEQELEQLKYAHLYATELWKQYYNQTEEQKRQIRITAELERAQKDYEKAATKSAKTRIALLHEQHALYQAQIADAEALLNNENYLTALERGAVEIVNGEIIIDQEALKQDPDAPWVAWVSDYQDLLKEAYNTVKEAKEAQEALIEEYKSILQEQYEREKAAWEKLQTSFDEYWEKIDKRDEEVEYIENRESLLRQISAASGGSDTASKTLRKDLLQKLQELNEEEQDRRREDMRDDVQKRIEDHVASIDKKIEAIPGLNLAQTLKELGAEALGEITFVYGERGHGTILSDGKQVTAFASGGLVDYTGPAWVDGTKRNPEAFLSATDTALIQRLVNSLYEEGTAVGGVTITNLNIHTDHLDNNQDFANAGRFLAEEFKKAMDKRGIRRNASNK